MQAHEGTEKREVDMTNKEFSDLCRSDFEVKRKRGWHTEKCHASEEWIVPQLMRHLLAPGAIEAAYQHGHDIGLLTKANAWYEKEIERPTND